MSTPSCLDAVSRWGGLERLKSYVHTITPHPYGGIEMVRQRLLRWQLSGIFPGQLPPRAPRRSSSTRAWSLRRRKVRGSRESSNSATLSPSHPSTICSPVHSLTLTGRFIVAAIAADRYSSTASGRRQAAAAATAATYRATGRGGGLSEVRLSGASACIQSWPTIKKTRH